VCETEIKVRQHGGYTVLAVVLALLGIALVGINKVCLDKMNRYHAIARGDIYSEVMRACPRASMRQLPRCAHAALLLCRGGAGPRGRDHRDGACGVTPTLLRSADCILRSLRRSPSSSS
jgi:hypothetical protein